LTQTIADNPIASEIDESKASRRSGRDRNISIRRSDRDRQSRAGDWSQPRGRRNRDGEAEDLADRMCRLGSMSGGLGNRDDDFVRSSTRRGGPRGGSRRSRDYESSGVGDESDDSAYDRRRARSRYGCSGRDYDEPSHERA
jgi:hypothetical protein